MLTINNTLDGYLKDVEILGNTIQSASNLADIRSVGDKVEGQELYEIPVLSCGENVFNNKWELGNISRTTGENVNSSDTKRTDFIKIGGSNVIAPCMPKYVKSDGARYVAMIFYDKNKKYLGSHLMGDNYIRNNFVPPVGSEYARFTMSTTITECEFEVFLDNRSFVAQGNVIESTPYQEDKITILSPVQLEKVGDVADRIIEKDGVWGVEKNTKLININDLSVDNSVALKQWKERGYRVNFRYANDIIYNDSKVSCMFNGILSVANSQLHNSTTFPTVNSGGLTSDGFIRIHLDIPLEYGEVNKANAIRYLKDLNLTMLVGTTQPQFIPLPHDQQVKLRTFASKTNISFLTEIEGTIKAQVPKSLGATVNTHTEQISNLNKELDRVKKLEENTVSTVETESDFTTVEATSNGYFEDVKLEGKTLVNIQKNTKSDIQINNSQNWTFEQGIFKLTASSISWYTLQDKRNSAYKENTDYTLVFDIYKNSIPCAFNVDGYQCIANPSFQISPQFTGRIVQKVNTNKSFTDNTFGLWRMPLHISEASTSSSLELSVMVLEGDWTDKNIPPYFEGLKSVGQGTDEIVVSSVNGDGNLFNKSNEIIRCVEGEVYYFNHSDNNNPPCWTRFYDINNNIILEKNIWIGKVVIPSGCKYLKINTTTVLVDDISFNKVDIPKPYTPHQSDKKRLLYYNEETQTWEKPILREWDSIEKHSNGKYYYHQRSEEVVLNGSENWIINEESFKENCYYFRFRKPASTSEYAIGGGKHICNIYKTLVNGRPDEPGIAIVKGSGLNDIEVIDLKTKFTSYDNALSKFKENISNSNIVIVYQLAEEKVYECTNIDLITYANETNYIVECGAIVPRTTLKVHNNISNVVSLLQKKVSLLESNITKYMITQNRMQLASTYSADSVTFKVDYFSLCGDEENYDEDLYNLILNNILVGKDNYDYDKMFNMILDYASWNQISWEQFDILVGLMDMQHNPPVEEIPTEDEIEEDIIEETPVE